MLWGVCGCFAGILVKLWMGIRGQQRITKINDKRINELISCFYIVCFVIRLFREHLIALQKASLWVAT